LGAWRGAEEESDASNILHVPCHAIVEGRLLGVAAADAESGGAATQQSLNTGAVSAPRGVGVCPVGPRTGCCTSVSPADVETQLACVAGRECHSLFGSGC
jgi:hypothetical protein